MEAAIRSYKDLVVWQKAIRLCINIYECTKEFPAGEQYGLTSQMRRSAVSIPSNIAEGSRRGSRKDFRQFLLIAYGSGAELETQLEIAQQLSLGDSNKMNECMQLLAEVMKMLNKFSNTLHVS